MSHNCSLAELGMDSMMAVEIKQTLERDFEVFLTPQDIRVLNIAKLLEMSAKDAKKKTKEVKRITNTEKLTGMRLLMKTLNTSVLNKQYCIELPVKCGEMKNEVFLIPGIEGSAEIFAALTSKLKLPATCLQLGIHDNNQSVEEMAESLLPVCFNNCNKKGRQVSYNAKKVIFFFF